MKKILLLSFFIFSLSIAGKAQWKQTNGPIGGNITCLTSTVDRTFAGTYGGVFVSANNGDSWSALDSGLSSFEISAITNNGSNVFIAVNMDGDSKIYRMPVHGSSWSLVKSINSTVNSLYAVGQHVFATLSYGPTLYESSNGGSSWNPSIITNANYQHCVTVFEDKVYVGAESYLYSRSLSGGNWEKIVPSFGGTIRIAVTISSRLVIATSGGSIYCNTGDSVFQHLTNISPGDYLGGIVGDDFEIYAGYKNAGINKYSFSSSGWTELNNGIVYPEITALTMQSNYLFAGTYNGLYKSNNSGMLWTRAENGLVAASANVFSVIDSNIISSSSSYYNFYYRSPNDGYDWYYINDSLMEPAITYTSTTIGKYFILGDYLSKDNGITWQFVNPTGSDANASHNMFCKDGIVFSSGNLGWSPNLWMFYSSDTCQTWQNSSVIPDADFMHAGIKDGNYIHIGTTGGCHDYRTSNFGQTWEETSFPNGGNYPVGYGKIDSTLVYGLGVYCSRVFISIDNGDTYSEIDSGKILGEMNTFLCIEDKIFAATTKGLFFSQDLGKNWYEQNNGLKEKNLISLRSNGVNLYAGAGSKGIWKRPLSEFVASVDSLIIPDSNDVVEFSIYPNPTSENITVEYNSNTSGSLIIYNLLGEQVQEISLEKNTTKKNISLTHIPSGIYFCVLRTADGKTAQQKLVVEK